MKKILCLTDFSVASENAVKYAAWVAQRCHATLTLAHVLQLHLLDNEDGVQANAQTITAQKHMAERTLHDTCEQLQERFRGDDKKTLLPCSFVVREGLLREVVSEMYEAGECDLIIMGTTGGGAEKLDDLLLGSNTVQIFDSNSCPVLAVPKNCHGFHLEKIVFATSCHSRDYQAIQEIVPFAECFRAQIHIVHVSKDDSPESKQKFEQFCRPIAKDVSYDRLHFSRIAHESTEAGLLTFVKQVHGDLIALMVKEGNLLRKYFHQSVAEQVAYNSKVPFLVLHEKKFDQPVSEVPAPGAQFQA